jgi:DNA-3-methyladenine glycosylase I
MRRCDWPSREPYITYHDREWGVPLHDDRRLFEFLVLEGAQAGLSWETILKKRDNYRAAFSDFVPATVARFTEKRIQKLLADPGIIRNRLKIEAAINNARCCLDVQSEFGSLDVYLWSFVGNRAIHNRWKKHQDIPARTSESEAMSKDLARRGFKFVGPTICYAFMQAVGMVNDHLTHCFRYEEIKQMNR